MRGHVGRKDAAIAVGDIGPARDNLGPRRAGPGFDRLGRGHQAHARADRGKGGDKGHAQDQKPELRPTPRLFAHAFMPDAQVFLFDLVGVHPVLTGLQDPGKRAKRHAHAIAPLPW